MKKNGMDCEYIDVESFIKMRGLDYLVVIGKSGIEAVCTANVIKYLWRYEEKNGLEDIHKAQWYLNRLEKEVSKNE